MNNYRIFFVSAISIVMLFATAGHVMAQSSPSAQVGIWNPSKVDWWVSVDESDFGSGQSCEAHWLFDDYMDVMMGVSDEGKIFFSLQVAPKNKNIRPKINLSQGSAQNAFLVIDGIKHNLGVTDIDLSPVMIIMALPDKLNDVDYVQDAERVLLRMNNTIHNFPLENMPENMSFFKKCLTSLNKRVPQVAVPFSQASPQPNVSAASQYSNAVEIEELPAVKSPAYAPIKTEQEPISSPALDVEPVKDTATQPVLNLSKNSDDIIEDLKYDAIKNNDDRERARKDLAAKECPPNTYDSSSAVIIQNLTTKMALLEKEKEELRSRVVGTAYNNDVLGSIMSCNNTDDELIEDPVNEDIIAKFEITLANLRSENELLKEALEKVEEIDTDSLQTEISSLEKQVDELIKKNYALEGDLLEYQLENEKKASANSQENVDTIVDNLLSDSEKANITPPKPQSVIDAINEKAIDEIVVPESDDVNIDKKLDSVDDFDDILNVE